MRTAASNLKERLISVMLNTCELDAKRCWPSIVLVLGMLVESNDEATMLLGRRGLSVLSLCFFHSTVYYQQQPPLPPTPTTTPGLPSVADCLRLLVRLCDTVAHHVERATDGIELVMAAWKEKSDVCKRALLLVNYHQTSELRSAALHLVKQMTTLQLAIHKRQQRDSTTTTATSSAHSLDALHFLVQLVHAGFYGNASRLVLSYATSTCQTHATTPLANNNNNNSNSKLTNKAAATAAAAAISKQQRSTATQQHQTPILCPTSVQLQTQALQLMGPHFPTAKWLAPLTSPTQGYIYITKNMKAR